MPEEEELLDELDEDELLEEELLEELLEEAPLELEEDGPPQPDRDTNRIPAQTTRNN